MNAIVLWLGLIHPCAEKLQIAWLQTKYINLDIRQLSFSILGCSFVFAPCLEVLRCFVTRRRINIM